MNKIKNIIHSVRYHILFRYLIKHLTIKLNLYLPFKLLIIKLNYINSYHNKCIEN